MRRLQVIKIVGALVLLVLLLMARNSIWNQHAQVDVWVMWERVKYWVAHFGSWKGMEGNEILPTTLLMMLIPMWVIPSGWGSYTSYLPLIIGLNLIVLWWHGIIVKQQKKFWIIVLLFGPLLLFRYDAWVTLTVLLGLISYVNGRYEWSGWWLGIATGMKVFPLLLLPYLGLLLVKEKNWGKIGKFGGGFVCAILVPVIIFLLMGGNGRQIENSLAFHSQKLISIESLPGSIITGWNIITKNHPPAMIPGNGIWAVPGPAEVFNKIWVIPLFIYYLFVIKDIKNGQKYNWLVPLCIMLIFLTFSKNLNPQYIWWFVTLLAMTKISSAIWKWSAILVVANQLVFPVFYTQLTDNFFLHNQSYWIFYVLLVRNVCVGIVTYLSLHYWWQERK